MSSLAALQEDKSQYVEQLDLVLASLKDDPGNGDLLSLKEELDTAIQMLDESIAELMPQKSAAPKPAPKAPSPPPVQEKWSRENHPAFKKTAAPPAPAAAEEKEDQTPVSYQVNDTVLAKWVSGDRGFYPARITSVTGSAAAPMYTVKFQSYNTVETLRSKDIRPVAAPKRKEAPTTGASASASPVPPPPPPPSSSSSAAPPPPSAPAANGGVISAAASMYPKAPQAAGEDGEEGPPAKKFKKIKAKKELEAGKNKWQDFNNKSKFGKSNKKDSMFRTPEGVHGRVGFVGSGQTMRKDPTRSRHVYQANEDLD